MKEKILEILKNLEDDAAIMFIFKDDEYVAQKIADDLGEATIGSETGKPQLSDVSDREKEAECDYCNFNESIFEVKVFDEFLLTWSGSMNRDQITYNQKDVFIDGNYIRYVDKMDSSCMDHGDKVKINYCPFCGKSLTPPISEEMSR